MIPEKMLEILKMDGVVAIATLGQDGPLLDSGRCCDDQDLAGTRAYIPEGMGYISWR
jgi:hypothetical protein